LCHASKASVSKAMIVSVTVSFSMSFNIKLIILSDQLRFMDFFSRKAVNIMPRNNVRVTHIQKRVCGIFLCMVNVGMIAMKELASP